MVQKVNNHNKGENKTKIDRIDPSHCHTLKEFKTYLVGVSLIPNVPCPHAGCKFATHKKDNMEKHLVVHMRKHQKATLLQVVSKAQQPALEHLPSPPGTWDNEQCDWESVFPEFTLSNLGPYDSRTDEEKNPATAEITPLALAPPPYDPWICSEPQQEEANHNGFPDSPGPCPHEIDFFDFQSLEDFPSNQQLY